MPILPTLYSMARIFAYPSFYEGFGIPVLEAMACGTPVITADNSSLPEVAGQAATLVPATDINALTQAIRQLHTRQSLREAHIEGGLAQSAKFSWAAAAQKLRQVYERF